MFLCKPNLLHDTLCDYFCYNPTASGFAKLLRDFPEIGEIVFKLGNSQIFVPDNQALYDAMNKLNNPYPDTIQEILLYHLVPSFGQGIQCTLLPGKAVNIQDYMVNDAIILDTFVVYNDNNEKNYVRLINKLLIPEDSPVGATGCTGVVGISACPVDVGDSGMTGSVDVGMTGPVLDQSGMTGSMDVGMTGMTGMPGPVDLVIPGPVEYHLESTCQVDQWREINNQQQQNRQIQSYWRGMLKI